MPMILINQVVVWVFLSGIEMGVCVGGILTK